MIPKEKSRFNTLYQKHLTALKLQGKADKTIEAYSRSVRRIAAFVDRCPDDLTEPELTAYFSKLLESHSWSTIKLDLNGIRFFYEVVLKFPFPWLKIVKPPRVQSLPDVLTADELARIIAQTRDLRFQSFWFVTYSMGLRLSETLNLEVGDIDRGRMLVHVRQSKGRKDRFVVLPRLALSVLIRLWRSHHHPRLLFPGREGASAVRVMDRGTTQRAFAGACQECGIRKKASIHSLRHSYATHLIEAGLNLRSLQSQLGHADPTTTARYVRLTERTAANCSEFVDQILANLMAALHKQTGGDHETR